MIPSILQVVSQLRPVPLQHRLQPVLVLLVLLLVESVEPPDGIVAALLLARLHPHPTRPFQVQPPDHLRRLRIMHARHPVIDLTGIVYTLGAHLMDLNPGLTQLPTQRVPIDPGGLHHRLERPTG